MLLKLVFRLVGLPTHMTLDGIVFGMRLHVVSVQPGLVKFCETDLAPVSEKIELFLCGASYPSANKAP